MKTYAGALGRTEEACENRRAEPIAARTNGPPVLSRRETAGRYADTVVYLSAAYRIIVCRAGLQWKLQKRRGSLDGDSRWLGIGCFGVRDSLVKRCLSTVPNISPAALEVLMALPAAFKTERQNVRKQR